MRTVTLNVTLKLTGKAVNMTAQEAVDMLKRCVAIAHEDALATIRNGEGDLFEARRCTGMNIRSAHITGET